MREFRFILGRRALLVFLAFLVATGAFIGVPTATPTLAESLPPGSQEVSAASVGSVAAEEPILDPSGHSPLLQGGGGDGWTETNTPIDPTKTPTMRYHHAMATAPSGVLLFGGEPVGLGNPSLNDTWLFNTANNTWSQITGSSAPPERRKFAMAATPSGNVLLFGGASIVGRLNDSWLFNTATNKWADVTAASPDSANTPTARYDHAMAATPSGAVLFGGFGRNGWINETWLFNAATNTWMQVAATGTIPSARASHAMAALPSGDVLLFGGVGPVGRFNDTWLFNTANNTWSQITGSPTPPALSFSAMATLPSGDVLLFGGSTDNGGILNDAWLFSAANNTWSQITGGSSAPPARANHAMAATPSGAVLFGGSNGSSGLFNDTWLYGPVTSVPTLHLSSPVGGELWAIGSNHLITWTSTDLNTNALTILLARDGVNFTEILASCVDAESGSWTWTVTGPGTINARVQVVEEDCQDSSPAFFTISTPYAYSGVLLTTTDPWLEISGGTGTGTIWVTPLTPANTSDPNLGRFIFDTGKRAALFFDISQEELSGTLTIVLHFNLQLGEETFVLYLWNGTGWVKVPGTLNLEDHTFTFTIDASLLNGTPFALGGDPIAMPGMSPWGLALLSLALLGMGGWWFLRRRRLA